MSDIVLSLVAISSPRFCSLGRIPIAVGKDQSEDEIGRRSAQHCLPNYRERRLPDSAPRSSTEDETRRARYRKRGERFLPDVLDN